MEYKNTIYYRVGRATDLSGSDRLIYRLLEILPGFLSWGTIFCVIIFSFFLPFLAAVFIIVFDLYWLLKTVYLSIHLRQNWKKILHNMSIDWALKLKNLKYDHVWHMILLPFYNEDQELVEKSLESLLRSKYDKSKMIVVLATEERAGKTAESLSHIMRKKYGSFFGHFIVTCHPANIPEEMPGKGSNIAYAAEEARRIVLNKNHIKYSDVVVSAFDIDTVIYQQYFECLTWNFLTADDPFKSSFQPVPFYNNNIWHAPALSRVVAFSGTFWQMIQQERPERLSTFSSHSICFKTLFEIGYWQKNMVSEDSRIFWNAYLANNGNYQVIPLTYPVSMDANLDKSVWQTIKNIYKQQRRWAWGVENMPYVLFGFIKNNAISFFDKIRFTIILIEGFWSWSTAPIMIFLLGWLPVVVGDAHFQSSILSYNLPIFTRNIMILAMVGLVSSAAISISLLPFRPENKNWKHTIFMVLQWAFVPITVTIFGAIPALDAQTRLLLGRYMGFWVTPKHISKNKQ
jgi:cellulose synthase/poly-beta-1,6-N-acetylglucosamine synthase-like glycosyltransferase